MHEFMFMLVAGRRFRILCVIDDHSRECLVVETPKAQPSFDGNLLRAFYLHYVDIWRRNRRASATLRRVLPGLRDRIDGTLADLPRESERVLTDA